MSRNSSVFGKLHIEFVVLRGSLPKSMTETLQKRAKIAILVASTANGGIP
jgi:hypothetical protein